CCHSPTPIRLMAALDSACPCLLRRGTGRKWLHKQFCLAAAGRQVWAVDTYPREPQSDKGNKLPDGTKCCIGRKRSGHRRLIEAAVRTARPERFRVPHSVQRLSRPAEVG